MTSLDTLKESIDALGYTFHEFKTLNDQHLENLERKDNIDLLLLQKMDRPVSYTHLTLPTKRIV